jgi:hypothetical protein
MGSAGKSQPIVGTDERRIRTQSVRKVRASRDLMRTWRSGRASGSGPIQIPSAEYTEAAFMRGREHAGELELTDAGLVANALKEHAEPAG